jgi:DNA (cytosine-5)-methyltransferase 1
MNGLALFAGVGGLELGIKQLIPSSRIICYVEGEAFSASVLVSKMEKGLLHEAPIWSNVRTFNGSIFSRKVDFISAGFPCQPFSNAGKLKGKEDERWLWNDIERIIGEVRPNFIFLENVSNFINGGIDAVLGTLAKFGFNAEYGCLKVSQVGGNHHRNRFFLFAYTEQGGRIMADSNSFTKGDRRNNQNIQKFILKQKRKFENLSYSDSKRFNKNKFNSSWKKFDSIRCGENLSHSDIKRTQIQVKGKFPGFKFSQCPCWWKIEPRVCRVVDGVADRVDRLRACGNGVVPYQAYRAYSELIERAIKRRNLIEN